MFIVMCDMGLTVEKELCKFVKYCYYYIVTVVCYYTHAGETNAFFVSHKNTLFV